MTSVPTTSAKVAIKFLQSLFARHGIPDTVRADNMPFGSDEMVQFSKQWGFKMILSSPENPKSNGLAEKGVQVTKNLIKKTMDSNQDINLALLAFRAAPNEFGLSPAQLLFGRQIRSPVPILSKMLSGRYDKRNIAGFRAKQNKQKFYHDQHTKELSELNLGDKVRIRGNDDNWRKTGKVVGTGVGPRSYLVDTGNNVVRRNRLHLHEAPQLSGWSEDTSEEEVLEEGSQSSSAVSENIPLEPSKSSAIIDSPRQPSTEQKSSPDTSIRRSSRPRKNFKNPDYEYY